MNSVRDNKTCRERIVPAAEKTVQNYFSIAVAANKSVHCPYYRNPESGKERWGLNAFSGKGSPQEIEDEVKIIEKLEGANFAEMSEETIRDIMRKRHLGIECSGFIAHVLDAWVKDTRQKRIFQVLKFPHVPFWKKVVILLRPFTHIDITTLVAPQNAKEFFDFQEICAGDLIRFNTAIDHAVLVTEVRRDNAGLIKEIHYAHSVREDNGTGVKRGVISIISSRETLLQQRWEEVPETGTTIAKRGTPPRLYHPLFL